MNTYMPYLEDMIQFESFPEIGVDRGALSKNEIREIVKFADEHFVEVIPAFQTLGHYENILSQKNLYNMPIGQARLRWMLQIPKHILFRITFKRSIRAIPSKYFHMGADESYDVGFGNSRKLVEQSDLATVHANHYKRIYDICNKNNKEVMMYGDIILSHPEILEKIPEDITIVDWHYFPKFNYPSAKTFDTAGFNYIVSPTVWNFNAAFPENFFAIPNIQTFIEDGINNNSMGMINSSWGDFGAETFREYNLYGYAWSAQCSWNISESDANNFNKTFFKQFFGTNDNKIELIYKNLTDPVNQLVWGNIWRHPLLDYRKADWRQFNFPQASKFYLMKNENSDLEILANFKESATNNKEFLDLLEFTLKLKKNGF
ncbi:MAG: family 20 glycosylhydrolase [Ignavibacteriales bacterium]|nr:family 20 glycosylhydrolase [Ignavibacteriales bacterium]